MIQDLDLPEPNLSFQLATSSPASQIAEIMSRLENVLSKKSLKNLVLVQGDTNSVLAASLAAVKSGTPLAHVEAGLRSFDWRMPEEHNRRMVDHISNYLFAPTKLSMRNLQREKVFGRIFVTGNTIIDAVNQHIPIAQKKLAGRLRIPFDEYAILTIHRSENVDVKKVLSNIVNGILQSEIPIIIPLHPRTKKMLLRYHLNDKLMKSKMIYLMPPQGYLEFLLLLKKSRLIITDSGGIQEEATSNAIHKRVLVLRQSTERQEAVKAKFAKIVNLNAKEIASQIRREWSKEFRPTAASPYGDGTASRKIIKILDNIQ